MTTPDAPALITQRIADLADWRGATLARMRALIREADPNVVEEWKWNVPVWSSDTSNASDALTCAALVSARTVG